MEATADLAAPTGIDSRAGVLAAAREMHAAASRAEVHKFALAVDWAILHPADSIVRAATVEGTEGEVAIAGPGAPLVAEFCIAELAAALDLSTAAGQRYLGDAVETRYRLPRLWARVMTGGVPVWRARRIAEQTKALPIAGADHVDRHLAPIADRLSFAQIERTVEDAWSRFDPVEAESRRREALDGRHFDVHTQQGELDGTVFVDGRLDVADALDLDRAISHGAQQLAELGCDQSLDVRRAMAAGVLARRQTALDLDLPESDQAGDGVARKPRRDVKPRQVVLYAHIRDDALARLAALENTRSLVTMDQVRAWCGSPDTELRVTPVIDLGAYLYTAAYQPTAAMREQMILTNPVCVFPRCTRPARACEADHIVPWSRGGPTATWNLAPLCRRHHRLKTHAGWSYVRTGATTFTWTSPLAQIYRVDTRHTRADQHGELDPPGRHTR